MDHHRRKSKEKTFIKVDQLALAKSAAWAWLQHGSESNTRLIHEHDARRPKIEPKPSRYKLEVLRNVQTIEHNNSKSPSIISLTSNRKSSQNSLLDNYEIERISRHLEHYIESSHAKQTDRVSNKVVGQKKKKKKSTINHAKGFGSCGSSSDDVAAQRRRPEKARVAVVDVANCRPWPWGLWA
ncbi:arogenate dehydratase 1 [Striga asiatica]|uniref:Arogenate dehydratase 1 n=1 Tax=Striga asiatica TaxID=4170 RepID=A0A5A7QSY5_STRAF|nr:arogenate dehydratase 1 [Striga asiatica]